jgi:hypothetical protein
VVPPPSRLHTLILQLAAPSAGWLPITANWMSCPVASPPRERSGSGLARRKSGMGQDRATHPPHGVWGRVGRVGAAGRTQQARC